MARRERIPELPPWDGPYWVGIDENGVGPRLGPLVVTSVVVRAEGAAAEVVRKKPKGALGKRIGDSKKLVAFDDSALGEAWARAIAARTGIGARTPDELVAALALDAADVLRAPCPSHHADMCWGSDGETFAAEDGLVESCARDLDRLERKGVRVLSARVAIECTKRLNDALGRGLTRFDVDLHAMERLTLAARDAVGAEVFALCGKVGGFDFYGERFGPLAGWLHTALYEGRARSEYRVPDVGRLAFVRDADDTHLVVALASLVGKWFRDHLMRRVVRFHRAFEPGLPDASGYHDPVTTRFIAASAIVRKERKIAPACFERRALYAPAKVTSSARPSPKRKAPRKAQAPREETSSS